MTHRYLAAKGVLAVSVAIVALASGHVASQVPSAGSKNEAWTAPRTPWGDPDLQGTWWSDSLTPLERPKEFAGREFLTDKEVAERNEVERQATAAAGAAGHRAGGALKDSPIRGNEYPEIFLDQGFPRKATNRTSLIVGPEGKIPLTPAIQKREAETLWGVGPFYTYLDPDTGERCITDGLPGAMWSGNTGGGLNQITQSPGYVVIMTESYRDRRIIPLDGSPHGHIRSWLGEPRGRWEGNTLVVDTTNFIDTTDVTRYKWQSQWRRATETLHLVERFTRVAADTINYQLAIEDPATFMRPWTVEVPITKIPVQVYEYACHEGNYGIVGMLSGTRAEEAKKDGGRK
jgi:hypothetical protein